jgi:hypothetical protein
MDRWAFAAMQAIARIRRRRTAFISQTLSMGKKKEKKKKENESTER